MKIQLNAAARLVASAEVLAVNQGSENVKALRFAFNSNGFKVGKAAAPPYQDSYDLKEPKDVTPALMKKVLRASGWKSQGSGLFPDSENTYYFEAKNEDGETSQAAYTVGSGYLTMMAEGNW